VADASVVADGIGGFGVKSVHGRTPVGWCVTNV
jgi:hypothetical protein